MFFDSKMFSGQYQYVSNAIDLMRQRNALLKADEIVSESKVTSRELTGYTGWSTWDVGRVKKLYQNQGAPGGIRRLDRSAFPRSENVKFLILWDLFLPDMEEQLI